jgi:hypothetical protein
MHSQLTERVAARHRQAKGFPTEEALEWYLSNHPKADKSNHWVEEKEDKKETAPEDAEDAEGGKEKPPKKEDEHAKKPSGFKGLSEKVQSALKKAPGAVQKFFSDKEHRKEVLSKATESIKKSPQTYAKKLKDAAMEEVHEFKEAGGAIKDLFKGKKLSDKQKHAVKTVAIHMAITGAAAALAAPTVLGGAAYFGQAIAKNIALKAVTKSLADLHLLSKVGDVGTGIFDVITKLGAEKGEDTDPHDALAALVMAKVQEEIENLSDEDLESLMEEAAEESETKKEAAWSEDTEANFGLLLEKAEVVHKALRIWIRKFPTVLRQAEQEAEGLESGMVWQDRLVDFWKETDAKRDQLFEFDTEAESLWSQASSGKIRNLINEFRGALDPVDHKARIEYAFGDPQFFPKDDRQAIAYPVKRLGEWARACEAWIEESVRVIQKAKKIV